MKRYGMLGSALGTVLFAAMFFRGSPAGPVASMQPAQSSQKHSVLPERASADQKKQTRWLSADGPWKASRQHFAGARSGKECPALSRRAATRPPSDSPGSINLFLDNGREEEATNPREDIWCIPDNDDTVQAVIAIIPDPVHSHMALVFD